VRKKLLILMTLVAMLTAGCIQADLKIDVKEDGSGTYSAVFAVNADLFKQLGGLSALDPKADPADANTDICQQTIDEAKDDNPSGAKIEPYKKGDFCGYRITDSFANIDEARDLLSAGTSTGGSSLENVTLEKKGTGWAFDAEWNPSDTGGSTSGADAAMTKKFLQGFSFVVRMKLPGGQVEQNADLIENDGTMVWNLDPTSARSLKARTEAGAPQVKAGAKTDAGKNINASAASSSGSSGSSSGDDGGSSKTWLYVVIALVVLAVIAAVVLMKRNKPKSVPPMVGMPGGPMVPDQMSAPPVSGTPAGPSQAPMMAPPVAAASVATAPEPTAGEPQWDAARNAYIQWDGVNARWMQYDQTAGAWKPIE
jgi:hypothetical protein